MIDRTTVDRLTEFEDTVTRTAETAHTEAMRTPVLGEVYLFHKASQGATPGNLILAREAPPGFSLTHPERCPINALTREQLRAWIRQRVNNAPILPVE